MRFPAMSPTTKATRMLDREKNCIPSSAPLKRLSFAPKLNRCRTKNQSGNQEHEKGVESGKNRSVDIGKAGQTALPSQSRSTLVSIPDRADRIQKGAPLMIAFCKEMERSDAEIKTKIQEDVEKNGKTDHPHTKEFQAP